jgi:hypothetical protein
MPSVDYSRLSVGACSQIRHQMFAEIREKARMSCWNDPPDASEYLPVWENRKETKTDH